MRPAGARRRLPPPFLVEIVTIPTQSPNDIAQTSVQSRRLVHLQGQQKRLLGTGGRRHPQTMGRTQRRRGQVSLSPPAKCLVIRGALRAQALPVFHDHRRGQFTPHAIRAPVEQLLGAQRQMDRELYPRSGTSKQGRPHYHPLVAVSWDTRADSFDWDAFDGCQEERKTNGPTARFREPLADNGPQTGHRPGRRPDEPRNATVCITVTEHEKATVDALILCDLDGAHAPDGAIRQPVGDSVSPKVSEIVVIP